MTGCQIGRDQRGREVDSTQVTNDRWWSWSALLCSGCSSCSCSASRCSCSYSMSRVYSLRDSDYRQRGFKSIRDVFDRKAIDIKSIMIKQLFSPSFLDSITSTVSLSTSTSTSTSTEHEHEHGARSTEHDEIRCDAQTLGGSHTAGVVQQDPGGDTHIERIGLERHLDTNPLAARIDQLVGQSICLVAKEHQHRTSPPVLP